MKLLRALCADLKTEAAEFTPSRINWRFWQRAIRNHAAEPSPLSTGPFLMCDMCSREREEFVSWPCAAWDRLEAAEPKKGRPR